MLIDQIKREVAGRFAAAGLPGAARAVLAARISPDGRLICGGFAPGLGYAGSAYDGSAIVPQAPRDRTPEGPDDYIRRALHAATSPDLRTVPSPFRVPGVALPGVAEARTQPWGQLPPAVPTPWRIVQLQTPAAILSLHSGQELTRDGWRMPAAAQHPVYQGRADQVVPRPGLSGIEALGRLLPTDASYATVRQTTEGWYGLRDLMEEVRVAHGPAAAVTFATAAMTDPEAQRLRSALDQVVARGREHTTWYKPTNRAMIEADKEHIASLLYLLRARMERVGRNALPALAYREVQGAGGYVYQQRPDGEIYIVSSPRGPGGQVQMGSTAWRAITHEIGPYRMRSVDDPGLISGLGALPPRRLPPPAYAPGPMRAVPREIHLRRVLVRVGLAAAERIPEGLLHQLADDAVAAELGAARAMQLPPTAPGVVARRRAALVQEFRARRSPCS